ncbi:MAG: beta-galactosidase, partial [Lachnospiraceae bacterium]|nr:beta-galactosidase [Lachnospiraceae bacterium]
MNTVALDQKGIRINGQYEILVVSSLFYFRIPRSKWESRMRLLKSAGYNAIDVYFPWNYHEKKPGEWDFTEERDVSAFLRLARENNLWVIARPGPYICSEWDGGGIPAWHYLSVPQSSIPQPRSGSEMGDATCRRAEARGRFQSIPQPRSGSEMGDATCRRAEARGRFQSIPQPRSGSEMEDATCRRAEVRGRFHKDFRIRQNDPAYLEELGRWYGKILPILKPYQWTEQGTVLLLQTENELDYYLCDEPQAYMESLAEMARREGITIPLIACCGQDDIAGSGGNAPGVIPAFNIYADSENTGLEIRTQKLYQRMAQRDCPLLVTETNREHSFLKRLLSCGAKMVSPYNQTAGTTADYYNAITNWGTKEQPAALLASDYDFCSMITPDGMLRADEYVQARLLNALRITCKEALAAAMPPLENTTASLNREAVLECGMRPAAERRRGGVSKASPNRKAVLECGMRPAAERRRGGVSKA